MHEHEHELNITPWLPTNEIWAKTREIEVEGEGATFDVKTLEAGVASRSASCSNVHVVLSSEELLPDWMKPNIHLSCSLASIRCEMEPLLSARKIPESCFNSPSEVGLN